MAELNYFNEQEEQGQQQQNIEMDNLRENEGYW